jgi:hypothetical protein
MHPSLLLRVLKPLRSTLACALATWALSSMTGCQTSPLDQQVINYTTDAVTFGVIAPQNYVVAWTGTRYGGLEYSIGQCTANKFYVTDSAGVNWYSCQLSTVLPAQAWIPLAPTATGTPAGAKYITQVKGTFLATAPSGTQGPLKVFNQGGGACAYLEYNQNRSGSQIMNDCSLGQQQWVSVYATNLSAVR